LLTDRNGQRRVVTPERRELAPIRASLIAPAAATPLHLSRPDQVYWSAILEDSDALYVQVNGLFDAQKEDFDSFVRRIRAELASPDVHHLILDVRHNNGGRDAYATLLLRTLVHFDMEPNKGNLYVLIGRNTYSAAQILITKLEELTDAVFVGEPSGSRPNFIGRTGNFTLPYSGLSGYISSAYSQNSSPEDHRIWIAPDIPVGLTSQQYFSGKDPALQAIRDLLVDTDDATRNSDRSSGF
jgi:C-terminal processing protease CtpA/Prc